MLLHLEQAIVVEGKYDKIKLSSIFDAVIVVTNGYRIFKDNEKAEILRFYARTTGIVIVTDSDSAGFKIRSHIKGIIPDGKIINVYVPDVFGKEKRKIKPSKEGKLGVEGLDQEVILKAFEQAGIVGTNPPANLTKITHTDLYELGLSGGADSASKRAVILREMGLPERMSTSALLEILNVSTGLEKLTEMTVRLFSQIN